MNEDKYIEKIDFSQILRDRFPKTKFPEFVIRFLKKIFHENDLNDLFASMPGVKNIAFLDGCMKYFDIACSVVGLENLPKDSKPCIFVSNHPLGALDAVSIGSILGNEYNGKIKFYANELLTILEPLKELFLPIYKYGDQSRESVNDVRNFFESDNQLIIFPAGATSRIYGNKIIDLKWHKNCVHKAVQNHRDIVPMFFVARNSKFFYRLEKLRMFFKMKVNVEMLFLVDEIFKQKGHHFTLHIGKPIPWQTFDKSKTLTEWAQWLKRTSYKLTENI